MSRVGTVTVLHSRGEDDRRPVAACADLAAWARTDGERRALVGGEETVTFAELGDRVATMAARVQASVGDSGQRLVPCFVGFDIDSVVAVLGVMHAGFGVVLLDVVAGEAVMNRVWGELGEDITLVVSGSRAVTLPVAVRRVEVPSAGGTGIEPAPVIPTDVGVVIFTSGSTGEAKGVMHDWSTVEKIRRQSDSPEYSGSLGSPVIMTYSLAFLGGLRRALSVTSGRTVHLVDSARNGPVDLVDLLRRERIESVGLVPAHLMAVADAAGGRPLDGLTHLLLGGDAVNGDHVRRARALAGGDVVVSVALGSSEAPRSLLRSYPPDGEVPDGPIPLGEPGEGGAVRLEPLEGIEDRFELVLGGPVSIGYFGDPERTAQRIEVDADGVRWWRSGDVVERLDDGTLRHAGRLDDLVKVNGRFVEIGEVERTIARIDGVRGVAVMVEPTERSVRLCAHVELDDGAELGPTEIRTEISRVLPPHYRPTRFVRHDRLPRTDRQKLDRRTLQATTYETWRHRSHRAPRTSLERLVVTTVESVSGETDLGMDDDLWALGLDSLDAVALAFELSETVGVEIVATDFVVHDTPARLVEAIKSNAIRLEVSRGAVVVLDADAEGLPVVCLPGRGGTAMPFRLLHSSGEGRRPLIIHEARGLHSHGRPHFTASSEGRAVADDTRRRLPDGPWVLLGYSSGCAVAHAAAVELAAGGEPVHLVLLDPMDARALGTFGRHDETPVTRERVPYPIRRALSPIRRLHDRWRTRSADWGRTMPDRYEFIQRLRVRAALRHRLGELPDSVRVMVLGTSDLPAEIDPLWAGVDPAIRRVRGDHLTVLQMPAVEDVVTALDEVCVAAERDRQERRFGTLPT